jgi:hypothetical protein
LIRAWSRSYEAPGKHPSSSLDPPPGLENGPHLVETAGAGRSDAPDRDPFPAGDLAVVRGGFLVKEDLNESAAAFGKGRKGFLDLLRPLKLLKLLIGEPLPVRRCDLLAQFSVLQTID